MSENYTSRIIKILEDRAENSCYSEAATAAIKGLVKIHKRERIFGSLDKLLNSIIDCLDNNVYTAAFKDYKSLMEQAINECKASETGVMVGHKGPEVGCWSHPNIDDGKLQKFDERYELNYDYVNSESRKLWHREIELGYNDDEYLENCLKIRKAVQWATGEKIGLNLVIDMWSERSDEVSACWMIVPDSDKDIVEEICCYTNFFKSKENVNS